MKKILVALDGTPGSEKALEAAVRLAQRDTAELAAVAVLDRPADPQLDHLAQAYRERGRHSLEELLQTAANFARARGVRLTPVLREGHPAETIITCAEQVGAELLVLGTNGSSPPTSGLGATADQVSSYSPCSVLLVK
jgi:nucleotide-binding universal stress UspA family protein